MSVCRTHLLALIVEIILDIRARLDASWQPSNVHHCLAPTCPRLPKSVPFLFLVAVIAHRGVQIRGSTRNLHSLGRAIANASLCCIYLISCFLRCAISLITGPLTPRCAVLCCTLHLQPIPSVRPSHLFPLLCIPWDGYLQLAGWRFASARICLTPGVWRLAMRGCF